MRKKKRDQQKNRSQGKETENHIVQVHNGRRNQRKSSIVIEVAALAQNKSGRNGNKVTESLARNTEEEINNEESNKSLAVHTVRNNENIQLEENTDEDHNVTY
jgi:hypothetical protein